MTGSLPISLNVIFSEWVSHLFSGTYLLKIAFYLHPHRYEFFENKVVLGCIQPFWVGWVWNFLNVMIRDQGL